MTGAAGKKRRVFVSAVILIAALLLLCVALTVIPRHTTPEYAVEAYDELAEKFESELKAMHDDDSLPRWERISASIGTAFYDPSRDKDVKDVFNRADTAVYMKKKEMRALRE